MKTITLFFFVLLSFSSFSQKNDPGLHPWVLCDGKGQPIKSSDQYFYFDFRLQLNMYSGKDFSSAKKNGIIKTGTYWYDNNFIGWTWSNGEKSGDWGYQNNLIFSNDGRTMLKDVE